MQIILLTLYVLPILLGILIMRKVNRLNREEENEDALNGTQVFLVFLFLLIPVLNLIGVVIFGIMLIKEMMSDGIDIINIRWLNRLFGKKD